MILPSDENIFIRVSGPKLPEKNRTAHSQWRKLDLSLRHNNVSQVSPFPWSMTITEPQYTNTYWHAAWHFYPQPKSSRAGEQEQKNNDNNDVLKFSPKKHRWVDLETANKDEVRLRKWANRDTQGIQGKDKSAASAWEHKESQQINR